MKTKYVLVAFGVFLILLVPFLWWTLSPFFIDKRVNEAAPVGFEEVGELSGDADTNGPDDGGVVVDEPMAAGALMGRSGRFDGRASYEGDGTAILLEIDEEYVLRFGEDFSVSNGPDLYVYFGNDGAYDPDARVARLKGNLGSQNYEIPEGINVEDYSEVWVWCRAFSVPFAVAELK